MSRITLVTDGAPKRPARLATSIVESLIDLIVSGQIAIGEVLPGEQSLCDQFGVSRVVVREALKTLEQKGLVVIRQGQGTVIAERSAWDLLDARVLDAAVRSDTSLRVLDDLVTVRAVLEAEMAALAATRRETAQLQKARQILDEMAHTMNDPERFTTLDRAFHEHIMELAGNEIATAVVRSIHNHAMGSERYTGGSLVDYFAESHRGHTAILQAIESKDAARAAGAMREHIVQSWRDRRPTASGASE